MKMPEIVYTLYDQFRITWRKNYVKTKMIQIKFNIIYIYHYDTEHFTEKATELSVLESVNMIFREEDNILDQI